MNEILSYINGKGTDVSVKSFAQRNMTQKFLKTKDQVKTPEETSSTSSTTSSTTTSTSSSSFSFSSSLGSSPGEYD